MENKVFTVAEMRSHLDEMSGSYDLARVVDPIECRILDLLDDGKISMSSKCYGIWGADQKCVNCSSAAACRTGCHQEKDEYFDDKVFHIKSDPVTLRLPDGEAFEAVMELVRVEEEGFDASSANDRAAENRDHNAAEFQAAHDHLTKVLGAGPFYEKAREIIDKEPGLSWVMISADIMNFRLVNNLFGIRKGNEMLIKTAAMLNAMADSSGGICGRLGGDRFGLLISENFYSEDSLLDVAKELSGCFSSGIYTFCIHFGVYKMDDASIPVSVMYGRANSALHSIRGDLTTVIACYDEDMLRKSLFEQEVISGFKDALNKGQFRMYLQPLVKENGSIFGAEALARWCREDGSTVMPADFIGTLENAGMIHELDRYMWELAVKQLRKWQGTPMKELSVSVNMSAKDFYSIDVYEVLTELIDRYGVDSSRLRLEITETALLEDPERSALIISKLRERGFLVEIDDFGKGNSSLSLLKDIEADVLKIDMSLLEEIENNMRSRIILGSIIVMAGSLGMEVITEGIETEQQLESLVSMGCSCFQGFYFSRPVPAEGFAELYMKEI